MSNDRHIPLYEKIKTFVWEKINSREWLPGFRLPTEQELAETFNVSRITSKRALADLALQGIIIRVKGKGSFVAESKESVNQGTRNIVSIILPYDDTTRQELFAYISGASSVLDRENYYLTVHCTKGESLKMEREFLLDLPRDGVSGIIYYPLNINKEIDILEPLSVNGYPIVTIDKYFSVPELCSVVSENYAGSYRMMSRLANNGHNKIAFITRNLIDMASSLKERYSAYCNSLKDRGLPFNIDFVITDYGNDIMGEKKAAQRVVLMAERLKKLLEKDVTALFMEYDLLIFDALRLLQKEGITLPENFCLAGFDVNSAPANLNLCYIFIEQDFYEIGKNAAELIIEKIKNPTMDPKKIEIPVSFIESL